MPPYIEWNEKCAWSTNRVHSTLSSALKAKVEGHFMTPRSHFDDKYTH